jgi:hypothetical protein
MPTGGKPFSAYSPLEIIGWMVATSAVGLVAVFGLVLDGGATGLQRCFGAALGAFSFWAFVAGARDLIARVRKRR